MGTNFKMCLENYDSRVWTGLTCLRIVASNESL
jgi:hypothetical protein